MVELKDKKKKVLRILVAAVLALGLVFVAKDFLIESGEKNLVDPSFFPEPPKEVGDVLGAFRKFFPPRERQGQDEERETTSPSVLSEIAEKAKEKIIEKPKEVVREKTVEVLKELINKLTHEEKTKEKVCEEVCEEVCSEVCE